MTTISSRGQQIPPSPIRKLTPFAEKAVENGIYVHHLNIGQPDIETPKWAMDRIRNLDVDVVEYSNSGGAPSLRKAFSKYYERYDIKVSADQLLITYGASEALMICLLSCLNAYDELIVPEPFYANYSSFAGVADITVIPVTSHIEDNFALPSISEFEKQIGPKTRAILICNPNNPTGYTYSEEELEQLKDLCIKHDLFLISDEVYREFYYNGEYAPSALNLTDVDDKVIVIDSASKRYSMCGVRIGAIVTRNVEVIETALKFGQARLSPPYFGQVAVEAALEAPDSYYAEVKHEYKNRKNIIIEELSKIPNISFSEPFGAFYTMVKLPIDSSETFCKWLLTDFSFEGETIMLTPGNGFYITSGLGNQEVRIAYVVQEAKLRRAMKCLAAALIAYPNTI